MVETILWIALIIIFAAVEIGTVGLTAIWFAGGACVALLAHLLGMGIYGQIILFIAVSAVLMIFTRPWALRYLKPRLVKTNYETIVGEQVCLTVAVDNVKGTGTGIYKGQEWTVRAYEADKVFEAGSIVLVKEIRGVTLYVIESGQMPKRESAV